MNESFYSSAIGAQQQMLNLNIQANNVANVNTIGYKAQFGRFGSLLQQRMDSIAGTNETHGTGAALRMTSTSHAQGAPQYTGRFHDYMIDGNGYFALVDLNTNQVTFTRNGAFEVVPFERFNGEMDEEGMPITETVMALSDGEGRFVLGRNGNSIVAGHRCF